MKTVNIVALLVVSSIVGLGCAANRESVPDTTAPDVRCPTVTLQKSGLAPVHGLNMYYEVHGTGEPLVLLHGAYMNIEANWGQILPTLACTRKVIAIEQQAHGRTADINRTLTYEQMADDTAELLKQLGVSQADFFGYSMGGATALQIAVRHPTLVRKLALASSYASYQGFTPETLEFMKAIDPANSEWWAKELREEFQRKAPHPEQWPAPIVRNVELMNTYKGLTPEQLRSIQAPTLVIYGDVDTIRLEHALEIFRSLPRAQLAVLPGTDHIGTTTRAEWLLSMVPGFVDAPMP